MTGITTEPKLNVELCGVLLTWHIPLSKFNIATFKMFFKKKTRNNLFQVNQHNIKTMLIHVTRVLLKN